MTVLEAADGDKGLELARAEHPDVVLLDVMMPGRSGWEVAEELLADESTRSIPIIFLTARAEIRTGLRDRPRRRRLRDEAVQSGRAGTAVEDLVRRVESVSETTCGGKVRRGARAARAD